VNLGTVHYYKKQFDSAKYFLQNALSLDQKQANAFNALAMVEIELKNYEEAKKQLASALSIHPKDPYFLNNRGYIFLLNGEVDKALEDINLSITLDPYNGWAYRNKGIYYLMTRKYEDAVRLLKRAEASDQFVEKIDLYLGEAYENLQDKTESCKHYASALEQGEIDRAMYESKCK
jgi:Flp pilus assembly protein TadD